MCSGISITVDDHTLEALSLLEGAIERGLTECGLEAERTAKQRCPVGDPSSWKTPPTYPYVGGTLRNSITFALDGATANTPSYKVENERARVTGEYKGQAPKEGAHHRAMYIGTNVYYAPYVEMGTSKYPKERPFIKPAIAENAARFKQILENALKNG